MHISFCHNPTLHDEDLNFLIEYHSYISDDRKHDSKFVQHCFKIHWGYMVSKDMLFNGIGFGVMDVHPNSKVANYGTLCFNIQI
jgi:hypothetical protein